MCLSCARELVQEDVHQIKVESTDDHGAFDHGPFCYACAQSAKGIPFAQWLDEQWQRQRPN